MSHQGEPHEPGSASSRGPNEADRLRDHAPGADPARSAPGGPAPARRRLPFPRPRREAPAAATWRGSSWGPPKKDRTNVKIAVWLVLLVALLAVSRQADQVRAALGLEDDGGGASAGSPPITGPVAPPGVPTRSAPFAGSPAVDYADNEAGIVVPAAEPVGRYSAADVRGALETTRALLITANLDHRTVMGRDTEAFRALVDPKSLDLIPDDPLGLLSRFDPSEVELVGPVIKVSGAMTYALDDNGLLTVHGDYTFVYPVSRAKAGVDDAVTRTVVRRTLETKVAKGGGHSPAKPGTVWVTGYGYNLANSSCERHDGYLHPQLPGIADRSLRPTGAPIDPYDRAPVPSTSASPGAPEDDKGCRTVSRV